MGLKLRVLAATAAGLVALGAPAAASAQDFPAKTIRLVVGPGADGIARAVAAKMSESLGRQVIVDQQPGAGGIVAAQTVARAQPDGYTLLVSTGSFTILEATAPRPGISLVRDFAPVALLATTPAILLANPKLPVATVEELVRYGREHPGLLNCASSGIGTTAHLGCEMVAASGKMKMTHVPFNGLGPAIVDLIAGRSDVLFAIGSGALTQVSAGKVKPLATTGTVRSKALPRVPTFAEAGYPGVRYLAWNGIHAPANTPRAIIDRLAGEFSKAMQSPEVQTSVAAQGWDVDSLGPGEFSNFVETDLEYWRTVAKAVDYVRK
jgi:tripartite-type tricarboxylate transporter receptor subunit TctC